MATQIDYRYSQPFPVDAVYAAIVDADALAARVKEIGGAASEVVDHRVDGAGVSFRVRHQLDTAELAPALRALVSGNLVVERTEIWAPRPQGGYGGTVTVGIIGSPVPAGADGTQSLVATDAEHTEFTLQATIRVSVPLFGGAVEESVAGQMRALLDAESQVLTRYLQQNPT